MSDTRADSNALDTFGISWQQAGVLRRERERGERGFAVASLFRLPDDEPVDALEQRVASITQQEEVLRIVGISPERSVVRADVDLPVRRLQVESLEELRTLTAQLAQHSFDREDGPLWAVAAIAHPDEAGRPAWSVCATFDHVISDDRSRTVLRQHLVSPDAVAPSGPRAQFREWVAVQRRLYPDDGDSPTPAREFWLRHLDGTAPDRPPELPFCADPEAPLSGVTQILYRALPGTDSTLRAAAKRHKASPFVIVAAAIAAAIARAGGDCDVTLKVNTLGRSAAYLDVLGMFVDNIPLRVRHPSLARPASALEAVLAVWPGILPHLTTPWDYILQACAGGQTPSTTYRPAQVLVNFLPWVLDMPWSFQLRDHTEPAVTATLQLIAFLTADGRWRLRCEFDPARYRADGVEQLLSGVIDSLTELV